MAGMPDKVVPARWFFGVVCSQCERFLILGPDPSNGMPRHRYAKSGTFFVHCTPCGRDDRYGANVISRRLIQPQEP